jgi:uncharacterized membrane protein YjfL (UPF0719 family)
MNTKIALLGFVEIFSAITVGIFILSVTYKLVTWFGKKNYNITERTTAFSIFTASILFSVGYLVSGVIQPLISSFRLLDIGDSVILITAKYVGTGAIYIAIAFVSALLIGLLSTYLYSKLTPIDEWAEIMDNNIGVALIVGSIVITLTLMCKSGVILIIESLIPYPELPPI